MFYSAVFDKQLCKEAAALLANQNADGDMPELVSVTPLDGDDVGVTNHNKGSFSFDKFIFNLDKKEVQVGKQTDTLGGPGSGSKVCDDLEERGEVERMTLQLGSISHRYPLLHHWSLPNKFYFSYCQ